MGKCSVIERTNRFARFEVADQCAESFGIQGGEIVYWRDSLRS